VELKPPRGTDDLLPPVSDAMLGLYEAAHRIGRLYGFRYVETPTFEHTELFARTRPGENPGSTTTASSVPSAPSSQQLVSNELSEKTSRYIGPRVYRPTRARLHGVSPVERWSEDQSWV